MKYNKYKIILTNGNINHVYKIDAVNKEEAIILAQAEVIKNGRGYKLVNCKIILS